MNIRVKLVFPNQLVREPILARLARGFDVEPNIRRADVDGDSGWIICELQGEPTALDAATNWLTETGIRVEMLGDVIEGTAYGLAWANDDATVFYTRPDQATRPYQLWRHRVGSGVDEDVLVMEEADERFHLGVGRTKDGEYVIVEHL